jgi:uncharacterized protein (UPF0332 family)
VKGTTEELLNKAGRSIEASRMLAQHGDYDFAASRAYYAMFYISEALLNERGLHFRKLSAVHAAFGEQFAKTEILDPKFHRWLLDSSDKRHLGDYEVGVTLLGEDVEQMIDQAREFLKDSSHYLAKNRLERAR